MLYIVPVEKVRGVGSDAVQKRHQAIVATCDDKFDVEAIAFRTAMAVAQTYGYDERDVRAGEPVEAVNGSVYVMYPTAVVVCLP
jgi:hypothetical protein